MSTRRPSRRTEVPQPPYGSTRSRGYHPNATRMSGRTEPRPERREVPDPKAATLVSGPLVFVRETKQFAIFDADETDYIIFGRDGIYVPAAWKLSAEDTLEIEIRKVTKTRARRAPAKPSAPKAPAKSKAAVAKAASKQTAAA